MLDLMPLPLLEATLGLNPYIPQAPTVPQLRFLRLECLDGLYGGAAGGGKSSALLAAALMFAEVPGYSALLLRRTFADLKLPGALIDRSHEWLAGTGARWNSQEHRWRFPCGSTLQFGYAEHEQDVRRYQSSEFQFIGIDEGSQFTEFQLRYLFSRLRRRTSIPVPLRFRLASNPGGPGHEWIRRRYIKHPEGRAYVPARLDDNPHIDRGQYREALAQLDPVTRKQLEEGDWDAVPGTMFTHAMLSLFVDAPPAVVAGRVRHWDKGYSARGDYTVGVRMSKTPEGLFVVEDVARERLDPASRNRVILATAQADDDWVTRFEPPTPSPVRQRRVLQIIERPPGAGTETTATLVRMLAGHKVQAVAPRGEKADRAEPFSAQVLSGNVRLVRGPWNEAFVGELVLFPEGQHDDCVDAAAGAFMALAGKVPLSVSVL
jgi:predicted phage terminase large subunit-like protein